MQHTSYRPSAGANSNQLRKVLITVCTVVAVFGLIIGFTVGALTRAPKDQPTNNVANNNQSTPTLTTTVTTTETPTSTATTSLAALGCPDVSASLAQKVSNTQGYVVKSQAQDTGHSCNDGQKAVKMKDVACKLWLVESISPTDGMTLPDNLTPTTLTSPIRAHLEKKNTDVDELPYLIFDASTPQVQKTDENGLCTWKYTLSPATPLKAYSLVVVNMAIKVNKPPFMFVPVTISA